MEQCNLGTKLKKVGGRRREWVSFDDAPEPPTPTMLMLAGMKNEGHSWRSLADEINERIDGKGVSHNLVRRVTLGHCKSPRIEYALGISPAPPPVEVIPCPDCGKIHKQLKTCKPGRKPGKVRFSVWVTVDERDQLRAAADCHPDGRAACLLENVIRGRAKP